MRWPLLLLSILLVPSWASGQTAPAAGPLVNPAQAAKLLDKRVTLQVEIKSTGGNTACFLNSAADFRDAGNFTIYLPAEVLEKFKQAKIEKPEVYYKGKTVQVTGTVTLYKEKPQIRVDDPAQIKVVERK
jgi:DNA/RNA endonuclease YhcR with UshA esterase domain